MKRCGTNALTMEERCLLSIISKINTTGSDISHELYAQLRCFETAWLSRNYSTDTIEQISAIPVRNDLPIAPISAHSPIPGPTGEVYYYLHSRAQQYASEQKYDLAIACQRKSNDLMRLKYQLYGKSEEYYLVRLLARSGHLEEAKAAKAEIDSYYDNKAFEAPINALHDEIKTAQELGTDYLIMTTDECACSECAKYQGRVYSISGRSKKYPPLPQIFFRQGCVHLGCTHRFFAYVDNISVNDIKTTLLHHPIKNIFHKRNIVSFSNRPFVDDRPNAYKKAAYEARQEKAKRIEQQRSYEDYIIEDEYQKYLDELTVIWLKENLPDKAPKNITGFRRMRTQNTKTTKLLNCSLLKKARKYKNALPEVATPRGRIEKPPRCCSTEAANIEHSHTLL